MEPKGSLVCLQEPAIGLYTEQDEKCIQNLVRIKPLGRLKHICEANIKII